MKKFLVKILILTVLIFIILGSALLILPNPKVQHNMMGALLDKHQRLKKTPSPKIIFIGGSNLSFGLDSKKIEQKLSMPVVNAGLHAGIGIKYYLNDIKPYIQKGDIVVVVPEYNQFHTNAFYGNIELVAVLFDVFAPGKVYVDFIQWWHLLKFIPRYAASKLKPTTKPNQKVGLYDRKAFNEYGDVYIHWTLPRVAVTPAQPVANDEPVLSHTISFLKNFQYYVLSRSALMVLVPPVYQSSSYDNQTALINHIMKEIERANVPVLARPEKYKFADSLFFDTYYHLTKQGVDIRTSMMIDDIQKVLRK